MTLKQFMTTVGYLPATALSGLVNLVLGSTKKDEDNQVAVDDQDKPVVSRGILGLALDGVKYVARSTADFIAEHKKAIAIAFWASLALAGAAALTVFLWPAALAAVTTFSVFGLSIAGVVGTNALLQIAAVAALTFAATSVATYLAAAAVNTFSAIRSYFKRPANDKSSSASNDEELLDSEEDLGKKKSPFAGLGSTSKLGESADLDKEKAPLHTKSLTRSGSKTKLVEEEHHDDTLRLSGSQH